MVLGPAQLRLGARPGLAELRCLPVPGKTEACSAPTWHPKPGSLEELLTALRPQAHHLGAGSRCSLQSEARLSPPLTCREEFKFCMPSPEAIPPRAWLGSALFGRGGFRLGEGKNGEVVGSSTRPPSWLERERVSHAEHKVVSRGHRHVGEERRQRGKRTTEWRTGKRRDEKRETGLRCCFHVDNYFTNTSISAPPPTSPPRESGDRADPGLETLRNHLHKQLPSGGAAGARGALLTAAALDRHSLMRFNLVNG